MTYVIRKSAKFRREYKTAQRRGWDISLLDHAIVTLASGSVCRLNIATISSKVT